VGEIKTSRGENSISGKTTCIKRDGGLRHRGKRKKAGRSTEKQDWRGK